MASQQEQQQQGTTAQGGAPPDVAAGGDIKVPGIPMAGGRDDLRPTGPATALDSSASSGTRGAPVMGDPKLPSVLSGQGLQAGDTQHGGVAGKLSAGVGGGLGGPLLRPSNT